MMDGQWKCFMFTFKSQLEIFIKTAERCFKSLSDIFRTLVSLCGCDGRVPCIHGNSNLLHVEEAC